MIWKRSEPKTMCFSPLSDVTIIVGAPNAWNSRHTTLEWPLKVENGQKTALLDSQSYKSIIIDSASAKFSRWSYQWDVVTFTPWSSASCVYCFNLSLTSWDFTLVRASLICSMVSPVFWPAYTIERRQNISDKLKYSNGKECRKILKPRLLGVNN